MENKQPLLSICIPTYNRARLLEENLSKMVLLDGFDQDVEVVISDNHSTDDTQQVGEFFASKFQNIKYYRNEENIRDSNFPLALDRATGAYVKLLNDAACIVSNGFIYLKSRIRDNIESKTPIFFTNDFIFTYPHVKCIICNSFDDYIKYLSTFVTAISCFGAWREDWNIVKDRTKCSKLLLTQEDWSYQIMELHDNCILYNERYYSGLNTPLGVRSGYNWFEVHLHNYYTIMQPYIEKGLISKRIVTCDKLNLYKHFIPELVFTYITNAPYPTWQYETKNTFKYFYRHYKNEYTLWLRLSLFPLDAFIYLFRFYFYSIGKRMLKKICIFKVVKTYIRKKK